MFSLKKTNLVCDFSPLDKIFFRGRVVADTRQLQAGDIFLAYRGETADGRDYIQSAIDKGVVYIIYDSQDGFILPVNINIPSLAVDDLSSKAGLITAHLLQYPSNKMSVVGVTGTNGKTSITQWLCQAFDLLDKKAGVIGTVGNGFWGAIQESTHTTPDAVTLQNILAQMQANQADAVAIEVSSHGLDQYRVNGVAFDTAVFTNLTRDHFDYHKTLEAYGEVKSRLFYWQGLRHAVINIDDKFGANLAQQLKQQRPELLITTYGFSPAADVCITSFESSLNGTQLSLRTPWGEVVIASMLLGRFNAQNIAAAIAVLAELGYELSQIAQIWTQIRPAKGRMDCIIEDNQPLVVVDYAHTSDALQNALATLQELKNEQSKLWCVFGCGGNRDKGKRPLMAQVATENADYVVVTSDNPRFEEPQEIINDILTAVDNPRLVEVSRQLAIEFAVKHASENDIVLIAGKGHENYQDIKGVKQHFDDFEIAKKALALRKGL